MPKKKKEEIGAELIKTVTDAIMVDADKACIILPEHRARSYALAAITSIIKAQKNG